MSSHLSSADGDRRPLRAFTAVLLLLFASGCGGNNTTITDEPDSTATVETVTPTGDAQGTNGFTTQTLSVSGVNRSVSFYAPSNRGANPPLIIAFHGTSGSSQDWISGSDPSGIEGLADEHGFVVAAPSSRSMAGGDWDHEGGGDFYWETAAPNGQNPDTNPDLMLVRQIIARAKTDFNINPKRVYLLGFSNGGFFAVLAAMALPNEIAAFAAAGSGLVKCDTTRSCTAQSNSTDCATILSSSGCNCTGTEKPIVIPASASRIPPAFVGHNNRDDVVSVVYSCTLNKRMTDLGYQSQLLIGDAEGHGEPEGFLLGAWSFLSSKSLP